MSTISEELNVNNTPLAERMLAQTLEEFVGQKHIV